MRMDSGRSARPHQQHAVGNSVLLQRWVNAAAPAIAGWHCMQFFRGAANHAPPEMSAAVKEAVLLSRLLLRQASS